MEPEVVRHETFGGLILGILTDLQTLVREEIALARVEIREQMGRARTAALSLAIAVTSLLFGIAFLLIAAAMAIAELAAWPLWAGFLVVAALMSLIGVITLMSGRRKLRSFRGFPQETVTTLKENSEWIAKRLSSARK